MFVKVRRRYVKRDVLICFELSENTWDSLKQRPQRQRICKLGSIRGATMLDPVHVARLWDDVQVTLSRLVDNGTIAGSEARLFASDVAKHCPQPKATA